MRKPFKRKKDTKTLTGAEDFMRQLALLIPPQPDRTHTLLYNPKANKLQLNVVIGSGRVMPVLLDKQDLQLGSEELSKLIRAIMDTKDVGRIDNS